MKVLYSFYFTSKVHFEELKSFERNLYFASAAVKLPESKYLFGIKIILYIHPWWHSSYCLKSPMPGVAVGGPIINNLFLIISFFLLFANPFLMI